MDTMAATPTKLRDGRWGARVVGSAQLGAKVKITTRAGKSWSATVSQVVWTRDAISICATRTAIFFT